MLGEPQFVHGARKVFATLCVRHRVSIQRVIGTRVVSDTVYRSIAIIDSDTAEKSIADSDRDTPA
jgi:hypothetical protein